MLKKWFRKKKHEKPTSQGLYVSRECLTPNVQSKYKSKKQKVRY